MRVLMGLGYYEPGGFATVINMLSKYLMNNGINVVVAARVVRMRAPDHVNLVKLTPEEFAKEAEHYDVVHIHTSYPYTNALVKRGLTTNLVFTWHGYAPLIYVPGIINKITGLYIKHIAYKSLIPRIKFITAISNYAREQLRKLYGVDSIVIPNGVNLSQFSECNTALRDKYAGHRPVIFNATAYNNLKGGDLLIKFFKVIKRRFPKTLLIAVGIHNYINKNKLSNMYMRDIVSLSLMPFNELIKYYCAADFYLLTSRIESFGLPIIESFAAGTPVIALDRPDARREHILNSGAGFLFKNEEELLRAVEEVMNNRDYYSRRAIEYAKGFDWSVITQRYIELYKKVLGE
ncbi:glycosyltransferase family 4 protein [Vulcanisaeta souniana]|uniref:Glycosyl transferase family 1 n=1 Tax=Vulcanisaeta souniana JCM 11219 TaxID=1293586 RepID=A0A830E5I1_9CREN|nr:glycosyltransferase family 4 protein [Vulcanisaeta souniana]BDR92701.1 glycosyl transferase family 1 [Vulcanisaeta souniana JCM 11219]GGI84331.1 glycosyl transferase family 1 [Vulcanisaeta souniana JCM 11219]